MRNGKLGKWIAGCIGFVVVLGICGLFITDYAVNRVMDSFSPAPTESAAIKGEIGYISNAEPARIPTGETVEPTSKPTSKPTGNPTGTVTKEQVKKVQENLTVSDKATVVSVILKNLSLSDLKKLRIIAVGGLTVEEKREAKQLLLAKLSSDNYNELSALAKKYGISKGKTYDEAKQEYNP